MVNKAPITDVEKLEIGKLYRVVCVDREFGWRRDEGQTRIMSIHRATETWHIDTLFTVPKGSFGVAGAFGGWYRLFYPVPDYVQSIGRGI